MSNLMEKVTSKQLKPNIEEFKVGYTVKVGSIITEVKNGVAKDRIQYFEGVVIARKGSGISETFTVRKESAGVGVERIFPLHSPKIASIEVIKKGKVRRAKLYFLSSRKSSYKIKEER